MVEVVKVEKVVEEHRVHVPVSRSPQSTREWVDVLNRLDWALQSNRMDLDDLVQIEPPLARVIAAYRARNDKLHRRPGRH
ncbi:hypothetical protein ACI3EY_15645 [Ornithinimicrobium sp. LYQ92]|uniref:hypothetical protein n=1 Tax=Serinicoccus sp. LYQ92 TaxID=3378798 RepID=UPI0038543034